MKRTTYEAYLQSVHRVIHHIETHYADRLSTALLAQVAGYSRYHFHRIFLAITGESLGEYIRKVRLLHSAPKLRNDVRVTDVAMESGYETPAAFAKAFKARFGQTPTDFSKQTKQLKGAKMIQPDIVTLDPQEVLCVRRTGDYKVACSGAWETLMKFAYTQKIKHKRNLMGKTAKMLSIGYDDPRTTPESDRRCDACVSYDDKQVIPEGDVIAKSIDGGTYLSYLHKGSYDQLETVYAELFAYIVSHEMTLADRPPFEQYLNRDPRRTKPENLRTRIYIPIER
jgi:AraC family transcriptional regulator